jgi:hypothetical protein
VDEWVFAVLWIAGAQSLLVTAPGCAIVVSTVHVLTQAVMSKLNGIEDYLGDFQLYVSLRDIAV